MRIERVLIVGLGSIGQRHLRLAREMLPDALIMVLRHRPSEEIPEFADACCSSIDDALAFVPNIAVIAGPSAMHAAMALPLAEAGVHLLIEKPLDASAEVALPLVRNVANRGVACLIGYNLRFLPSLGAFREFVHSGRIGRVLSVRCEIGQYLPGWRPGIDYRAGVSASRELGGGAVLELSHEIDYLRWIFGEIAWVKAVLSRQSDLEIDVEDTAHLILGFAAEDNVHPLLGTLSMDFVRHDTTRTCIAIGEHGSLRWNALTGTVDCFDAGSSGWTSLVAHPHQRDDSYRAEWAHFLACVRQKVVPLISAEDGWRTLCVADAARRASAEDRTVRVELEFVK